MNTKNIRGVLDDLQKQKSLIDEAMKNLRILLEKEAGQGGFQEGLFVHERKLVSQSFSGSYLDLAVKAIEANGCRPMHVNSIIDYIRLAKGNPHVKRQSVDATFWRHITTKGESSRITRVSPGMYGVREAPREESAA